MSPDKPPLTASLIHFNCADVEAPFFLISPTRPPLCWKRWIQPENMRLQTRYTASFLMVLFCRIEGVDGECVSSSSYGFFYGVYTAKCTVTYGIIFTVSLLSAAVCCATLYMSCSLSFSATPCSLLISIHCMFYALFSSPLLSFPISSYLLFPLLQGTSGFELILPI